MATAGPQILDAVNEILEVINEGRISALASSGSFPAKTFNEDAGGLTEYMLTRISRRVQSMGWPENTELYVSATPVNNAGTFDVVLGNTILWVRGSGASAYRNLTIRGGLEATGAAAAPGVAGTSYLWDEDRKTRDFLTTTAVTIDQIRWLDFDNLQPRTKDVVIAATATIMQRRRRGSPDHNEFLTQEQVIAELVASRPDLRLTLPPINPNPQMAQVLAGGRQQQQ